jgi:transposase InsO family protein
LEGEILYLYLVVSPLALSSALVREEAGVQRLVYFMSKALHGAEERYPRIEKLAFTLVVSAHRMRPYFQSHAIRVLTEFPLRKNLQKPDLSGRLVNWAVELGQFDIEFHPRTAITTTNIISFLWRSVVCRFGIPHAFVTDNGTQFDCHQFRKWCSELHIRNYYSSVLLPKANGHVEAMNKTLMRTLKKKLQKKKGAWVEYVPEVLWSYQTTVRTPTGDTPLSLTYGTEAVIPVEVGTSSFRVAYYNSRLNDEGIRSNLDLLQEKRNDAQVTWATYQDRTTHYFNKAVNLRKFQVGDWVLRKVSLMTKDLAEGKMAPKWEGPYQIVKC